MKRIRSLTTDMAEANKKSKELHHVLEINAGKSESTIKHVSKERAALPTELMNKIFEYLDVKSRKDSRLVSKQFASIGALALKKVSVTKPEDLDSAVRLFTPGGISEITLSSESFRDADLKRLPQGLKIVNVRDCDRITCEGIKTLADKGRKGLPVIVCSLIVAVEDGILSEDDAR